MTKPKLLLTRLLPPAVEARAARDYAVSGNPADVDWSAVEIADRAAGCDAILTASMVRYTVEVIDAFPDTVRMLATCSVGYEHIDIAAATARGITVTNTPDVLTEATADLAFLCLLGAARRGWEAQTLLRAGGWVRWEPNGLLGVELHGKRLGILGMGRIGRAVARRARGFGLEIHYHNRSRLAADDEQGAIYHDSIDDLMPVCDFLSINAPASPETLKFLNAARIDRMPDGAIVVNTARGDLVEDNALIAALQSGKLFAAGLDVFSGEPNFDPRYADLPNAYLMPHIGSATVETRNAMGFRSLDNLDAFFAGDVPPHRVT